MSKEIYHAGWLIKSPPKKSIWLPKQWRRRWFTLKQGEIPEQFCLEYYEDNTCRILKGVIDLDQCEQVDSGLRLEHKKQKFQHMFDVKTPRRTYYLAADSEADMIDWVNCICQVCNLQDLSKQQPSISESRQYYNVGADAIINQPQAPLLSINRREQQLASTSHHPSPDLIQSANLSLSRAQEGNSVYQNFDAPLRNTNYTSRDTMICDTKLVQPSVSPLNPKEEYYNFTAIAEANRSQHFERSHSLRTNSGNEMEMQQSGVVSHHGRTQSLIEPRSNISAFGRKIPENLKLNEKSTIKEAEPSPALSTSSGPYIAISECISGTPFIDRDPPATPLNSLDPKFYETPRNHVNIGLNLTNEQPYSPKRNNGPVPAGKQVRSGRSSPTDSESVFTDDEDWVAPGTGEGLIDRRLRPSDSSIENDSIVYTYTQRFSKIPGDEEATDAKLRPKRLKQAASLVLSDNDGVEPNRETNSSDTENASPAIPIGPKNSNSCVEENYDIPRSHQMPYYNLNQFQVDEDPGTSPTLPTTSDPIAVSTPNLADSFMAMSVASTPHSKFSTLQHRPRPHFYTNAAPTKIEGNVFRYDFAEQEEAPAVNRKLKPRIIEERESKEVSSSRPVSVLSTTSVISGQFDGRHPGGPPCIDRKLKPSTPLKPLQAFETNSLRRKGPATFSLMATEVEFQSDANADTFAKTLPRNFNNPGTASTSSIAPNNKQVGKLEYFDLDHSNAPAICKNANNSSASTTNLSAALNVGLPNVNQASRFHHQRGTGFGSPASSLGGSSSLLRSQTDAVMGTVPGIDSGIVYKSVDFIKTEAFMRTRQDAEKNRNLKNRAKD